MLPMGLYGMPDGSAVLQDLGNRRFLTILADGKIGKAISPPTLGANRAPAPEAASFMMGAGLMNVRGADARGNLYFQGMGIPADGQQRRGGLGSHHDLGPGEPEGRHRGVAADSRQPAAPGDS